ncbi:double zinc ribbon domain-containing protein [Halospeciosus flavus]|uniref:Zinc ribbon domain-containing protein n=1 Tax=Halospeciosus flavus TaxID=3032283 RepID=A0ABD5Z637_9EURY|nr:zinc ribbon domain-containing protein [Halospeciosus flavus]
MRKITFRADADLVERVESLDASKSEVMREALREYLDGRSAPRNERASNADETLDDLVERRVDELVEARLDDLGAREVNVNVELEDARAAPSGPAPRRRSVRDAPPRHASDRSAPDRDPERTCAQCGESVDADHAYCPNCGEDVTEGVHCDCGVELSPDWMFCPHCGRRTPSADVLDR